MTQEVAQCQNLNCCGCAEAAEHQASKYQRNRQGLIDSDPENNQR